MKTAANLLVSLCIILAQFAHSQTSSSPAEQGMAAARRLIDKNAKNFEAYNALALALSRRARETSDVAYDTQPDDALKKWFEISPANFDRQRTGRWLLLGTHQFPPALKKPTEPEKTRPDHT